MIFWLIVTYLVRLQACQIQIRLLVVKISRVLSVMQDEPNIATTSRSISRFPAEFSLDINSVATRLNGGWIICVGMGKVGQDRLETIVLYFTKPR